jgi:hypothetical protein
MQSTILSFLFVSDSRELRVNRVKFESHSFTHVYG